ncbi:MAG: hypothetical protein AAFQ89_01395 [Cyanobacteria bacterium J06626_18]
MDRTLLTLLVLSIVLIAMSAPQAMLTLTAVLVLSALATQGTWVILRSFEPARATQKVLD